MRRRARTHCRTTDMARMFRIGTSRGPVEVVSSSAVVRTVTPMASCGRMSANNQDASPTPCDPQGSFRARLRSLRQAGFPRIGIMIPRYTVRNHLRVEIGTGAHVPQPVPRAVSVPRFVPLVGLTPAPSAEYRFRATDAGGFRPVGFSVLRETCLPAARPSCPCARRRQDGAGVRARPRKGPHGGGCGVSSRGPVFVSRCCTLTVVTAVGT